MVSLLPFATAWIADDGNSVIHSAKVASYFRRSEEFGIPKRNVAVDMRAVRERKRTMVSHWNNVYLNNYKKSGAEFILGSGRFVGPRTSELKIWSDP
jgi:pyruvate/2-oxoglutarate dehydrogenase complex dihydrolipoamide dehydrogenase (E3) component